MKIKLSHIIVLETIALAALLFFAFGQREDKNHEHFELLSSRISHQTEPSYTIINFRPLRTSLEEYISKKKINASVYVENFRNGAYMGINEREGFIPASMNKLLLAIIMMRKVEAGELSLKTPIKITETDKLDTYGSLYKENITELSLELMLERLLKESDNTAQSALLHYVSSEEIDFVMDYYGIDIRMDFPQEISKNHSNTISTKSMSNLFLSLYFSTVLEPKNSQYILSLMKNSSFDINEAGAIPSEIMISHKFGHRDFEDQVVFHDCGIMYIEESRIFYCIMTQGLRTNEAIESVGIIANGIYEYVSYSKELYGEKYPNS